MKIIKRQLNHGDMTANELMIGNYVYYNGTNRPSNNVVKIDGSDINVMSFKKEYLELHRPISLNQDWLERAGAQLKSLDIGHINGSTHSLRNIWYVDDIEEIPEWIKYVHELQNWYYWKFMKTELKIK